MRCPVCGSDRLAWSDESGYLVCQDCGAVISELIDDGPSPPSAAPAGRRTDPSPPLATAPLEEAVEEASRRAVTRGRVLVVVGRSVRLAPPLIRRPRGVEPLLEVMKDFPDLRSRTERVRAAIAIYVALRAAGLSRSRAAELASRATGASPRSVAKVWERHRTSMEGYERAVAEALGFSGGDGPRTLTLLQELLGADSAKVREVRGRALSPQGERRQGPRTNG